MRRSVAGRAWRWLVGLAVGALLVGSAPAPARAADEGRCFAETGFCLHGRFLAYWEAHGGLALNGFPLSPERTELLEDGKAYTVQYCERVRLEFHPENDPPYDVLLGQFGREALRHYFVYTPSGPLDPTVPAPPMPEATYFPQTGHNLGGAFRDYWATHGGLAQFGYPLTEVFTETVEDGKPHRVQYCERVRLEWHPEQPDPQYQVLLGQFGRTFLQISALLSGPLGDLYRTDARVRDWLGPPLVGIDPPGQAVRAAPGAALPFEHGLMLRFHDRSFEYFAALCGGSERGTTILQYGGQLGAHPLWAVDWQADRPGAAAQPGPMPGTYLPGGRFGLLWAGALTLGGPRETQSLRDCLGYATSPTEAPYTVQYQAFPWGYLLTTLDPTRAYVVYMTVGQLSTPGQALPLTGVYQRLPLPVAR